MGRLPGFDYRRPFFYMVTLEPQAGKLDNATLYRRCHEMGDLIRGLGPDGPGPATLSEALEKARGKGQE